MIRSVQPEDEKNCIDLLGDPTVMEKLNTGAPFEEERVKAIFKIWRNRWENQDPFSVYTILKKELQEFMGIISIGHSEPGVTETSYVIHDQFWGNGYGSEAANSIHQVLIPRLMLRGYHREYKPLTKVVATARLDDPASKKILIGVGFQKDELTYKYGAWRDSFSISAKLLKRQYHQLFTNRDNELFQQQCS